jgi:hypothetical protein
MPTNGNYTFFGNFVINWSWDDGKQQLTVWATLNGKPIGNSVVLEPGHTTGTIQGSNGGQSAQVNLAASFSQLQLGMDANETNPSRSGVHTSDF